MEGIVGNMGADLDHGPAEEVDDEAGEADIDGGDAEVAAICDIAEGSREPVMEQIYEIQEVDSLLVYWMSYSTSSSLGASQDGLISHNALLHKARTIDLRMLREGPASVHSDI